MAWVQPTTPAKQRSVEIEPRTLRVSVRAAAMAVSERTSTAMVRMRACGNWVCSVLRWEKAVSGFRSQRARPVAPCSRRARAASRARVPVPPVTWGVC